ncbi:LysM peptidoglycan-binding domain-containing protein [Gemelliphila palaticanis]|uniref:LysM peptidoglycan-binding domain-containing protein n=1 Tax=Gemelliphila palaticanis TaxID=81950 RepID=A0ABX2SZQ1_9BACL|nr:LysM peptidoglycan-binding domain-containing protein [Gemella palaticanis]MBF0715642.1 LysM peptidoglycan-binding domain-containing protein [Gemella palaticanis]NYS47572.1 LysM peptidoglycan-binding domain-containing protein [Gemella palaticanis]
MNKNIKTITLLLISTVLLPALFYFNTYLANKIGNKDKPVESTKVENVAQVPQEEKKEQVAPPAAENDKYNNSEESKNNQSSNSEVKKDNKTEGEVVAGTEYTIKAGDTLFVLASKAYGPNKAKDGVDKIKKENNMTSDRLEVGQNIKIPE